MLQSWPTWLIDHDMHGVMITSHDFVSDIVIFVLKRDVKLQLTSHDLEEGVCWQMGGHVEYPSTTAVDCGSLSATHSWFRLPVPYQTVVSHGHLQATNCTVCSQDRCPSLSLNCVKALKECPVYNVSKKTNPYHTVK